MVYFQPFKVTKEVLLTENQNLIEGRAILKQEVKNADTVIRKLEDELLCAKAEVAELKGGVIETKEGKTFTNTVRIAYYDCLTAGVSVEKMATVVPAICTMAEKSVADLPSKSTAAEMLVEAGIVAKLHAAEELANTSTKLMLHNDGTSKKGQHFAAMQFSDTSGRSMSVGVQEMLNGSAQSYFDVYTGMLNSLAELSKKRSSTSSVANVAARILANTNCTMSDRHIVEKKLNSMLDNYKKEFLPTALEEWEDMTEAERDAAVQLEHFYCGLHLLIAFAEAAEKQIKLSEPVLNESDGKQHPFRHRGESGSTALIRAINRMIFEDGAGCPSEIATYLKGKGINSVPLIPLRGTRFNSVFANGAGSYFLGPHIEYFIKHVFGTSKPLLGAILNDMAILQYKAALKALGLLNKYLTGPLWRLLESSEISVLETHSVFKQMTSSLREWSQNASELIAGRASPFTGAIIHRDAICESLVAADDCDQACRLLLQNICADLVTVCERQLEDQLTGVYSDPSQELKTAITSKVKTNTISERDFGILGKYMMHAPNCSLLVHEARIMYQNNHTGEWIHQKSPEIQHEIIQLATKEARLIRKDYKDTQIKLHQQKLAILQEKKEELTKKEEKTRVVNEHLLSDLTEYGGLWITAEQVNSGLTKLKSETRKRIVLKTQLKVRKNILNQKADSTLFAFSCNGKLLSSIDLAKNLIKLLESPVGIDPEGSELERCLLDPSILVGKNIKHKWVEADGSEAWYDGKIEEQVTGSVEFRIEYSADSIDAVYLELDELITDCKNGDLNILW